MQNTSRLSRYSDGLRTEQPEFDSQQGQEIFSTPPRPDRLQGPPSLFIQWVPGTLPPEVKRPGREAYNSPPSSAEVKNGEAIPSLPICLHGVVDN
jgi:hypothetical protein